MNLRNPVAARKNVLFYLGQRKDPNAISRRQVPHGIEVYEVNGPLFFGVADRLKDVLSHIEPSPKVFILRMRRVPVDRSS